MAILLFGIGLETDPARLLRAGGAATAVAVVGVALPFALGYLICRLLGYGVAPAIVVVAALPAASVSETGRGAPARRKPTAASATRVLAFNLISLPLLRKFRRT